MNTNAALHILAASQISELFYYAVIKTAKKESYLSL